jgi:hypothetical protein
MREGLHAGVAAANHSAILFTPLLFSSQTRFSRQAESILQWMNTLAFESFLDAAHVARQV